MAFLGKDLKILTPITGGYGTIIAASRSCEVNVEGDQLEVSSPNDGQWHHYIASRKGWSISVGYLLGAGTFPTEVAMVNTTVTIVVSDGTTKMQGSAIVKSWHASGNLGNLATGSFVFLGNGPLSPVTQE
jgi:predicted secreted protein